jgi:hypothetical protein
MANQDQGKSRPGDKENLGGIEAIVYSELVNEGAIPVAWYPPDEQISYIDLTNISLKSISLLVGDKQDKAWLNDPRFIVDQTGSFAIIPFPDQDTVAIAYMFNYTSASQQNVISTITATVKTKQRHFLFDKHGDIEQLLKFSAFELLKLVMRVKNYKREDLVAQLKVLHEKLAKLASEP